MRLYNSMFKRHRLGWHQAKPPLGCSPDYVTLAMLHNHQYLNSLIFKIEMILLLNSDSSYEEYMYVKGKLPILASYFCTQPLLLKTHLFIFLNEKRSQVFDSSRCISHIFESQQQDYLCYFTDTFSKVTIYLSGIA